MQKLYVLIFFLLVGCGSVEIKTLEYQNEKTKIAYLEFIHDVSIKQLSRMEIVQEVFGVKKLINLSTKYQKRMIEGQENLPEMIFYFRAESGFPDLKEQAKIAVDTQSYDLVITEISSFTETRDAGMVGAFGVSSSNKILNGKITISQEIEQKILAAKKIEFSISAGNFPINLEVTKYQLGIIKEFLNYKLK